MVRARELRWGVATAGVVTVTLFAVPAWSPLYADGQHRSPAVHQADDDHDDDHDDDDECLDDDAAAGTSGTASTPSGAPSTSRTQVVAVRTPATAMIRVDAAGRVLAAWTNTGCAPKPGDDLWTLHPDGTITPARASIVERRWRGDFSRAGVFVDQRGASGSTSDD